MSKKSAHVGQGLKHSKASNFAVRLTAKHFKEPPVPQSLLFQYADFYLTGRDATLLRGPYKGRRVWVDDLRMGPNRVIYALAMVRYIRGPKAGEIMNTHKASHSWHPITELDYT